MWPQILFEMLESFRKVSLNVYCRVSFTLSYVFIVNFVACHKRSAWRLINVPSTLSFCSRVFQWSVKHEKSRLRIYYFSIRWFTFTLVIGCVFAKWDVSLNISESVLFTASLNDFKLTVVKLYIVIVNNSSKTEWSPIRAILSKLDDCKVDMTFVNHELINQNDEKTEK